ncbi:MAG: hypothetical protein K2Q06_05450, partial [Parvularculaceae bacterium]|nr:hypothetical protein [Parvularculaceae bacterium]
KFAADMAVDLAPFGVAAVTIWMGGLLTERLRNVIAAYPAKFRHLEGRLETPEFTGRVVWALYNDPALTTLSGRALIGAELARQYGIVDEGGRQPPSARDTLGVAPREQYPAIIR